ncbi:MAG TPA: hypothetical protein VF699_08900 [Caulobacteraceae bacterium]|jgi:hypothetical protein
MGEIRKDERADANQVGGAFGNDEGGPATRMPNEAQIGGQGPQSIRSVAERADQETPGTGQSGPGEGEGRSPLSDRASGD